MRVWRRVAAVVGSLLVPASLPGAPADWLLPSYEYRAVFQAPSQFGTHVLMTLPLPKDFGAQSGFALADIAGSWVPFRLVHADDEKAAFLVEIGAYGRASRYALYYRATPDPDMRQTATADSLPVLVTLHRMTGRNVPNTWEKMAYLYERARSPVSAFFWPEFAGVEFGASVTNLVALRRASEEAANSTGPRRTGWKRRSPALLPSVELWILRLSSVFLCPRDGVYRLAVSCDTATFVSVDGKFQVGGENRYGDDEWRIGPPLLLKAGPHRLEALTCAASNSVMRVGWIPPPERDAPARNVGVADVVPIPRERLLAASEAADVTCERRDAVLRPAFTFLRQPPYVLRGYDGPFTPVKFRNASPQWGRGDLTARWLFGDGAPSAPSKEFTRDATEVLHIFPSAQAFTVALELRDAQGFTERVEKVVDCTQGEVSEYRVDFDVMALRPIRYASDVLQPILRYGGRAPSGADFAAQWTVRDRDGDSRTGRQPFRLRDVPGYLPLARLPVGDVAGWDFLVEHAGRPVRQAHVRFLAPPFEVLPMRVEGDRLYAEDGSQLVLVPGRHAGDVRTPGWPSPPPRNLVWLDDALGCPGLPAAGEANEWPDRVTSALGATSSVTHVPIDPWETKSGALAPLLRLANLATGGLERADAVILSVGLQDLLQRRDAEEFERFAAAMSDIVSGTLRRPTLWVTLPPYPFAGERTREYAVAVRRVADARGLRVADLYTAFSCAAEDPAVFFPGRDLALSRRGRQVAVAAIARAVAGGKGP